MGRIVPVLAPSEQTEGTQLQVLRWLKAVGANVVENEPLIEIETDKVTVEVPAPVAGVLRQILRNENDEVAPGELLGHIESDASASDDARPGAPEAATHVDAPTPGESAVTATARTGIRLGVDAAEPSDRESRTASERGFDAQGAARELMSPAVRRLLAEHAVDASSVAGSGRGGRITVDDVLRHVPGASPGVAATRAARRARKAPARTSPTPSSDGGRAAGRLVPHSSMRRRIAEHMVESLLHTAPHVTALFEADMTAVLEHRSRHRADFAARGAPLTLTPYFLRACVAAIREVPEANSRWTDSALELYEAIHIGVGTALEGKGLVVPVVKNVQALDLYATARDLGELVVRAREDRLTPADVRGGTFTISNHGVSGSLLAAPIVINQPQSAILGIGKVEKRAVVVERDGVDVVVVRPRCYVTLTIDHRVMDGHRANRFLEVLVRELEGGVY